MTRTWFDKLWNNCFGARKHVRSKASSHRPDTRRRGLRLGVEQLEDRITPASTITVLSTGIGSLDATFLANNGVISVTDGASGGTQAETLSATALLSATATTNISVSARASITFNDLGGALTLATGLGNSATFQVTGPTAAAISFVNTSNTLATSGGTLNFTAGTNLTLASLNANGGSINVTAGTNGAGNVNAQALLTSGTGNITVQATNAAGGTVTQAGQFTGQAINVTATGTITVDAVKGTTVTLISNTGSVNSAGANSIQASAQLTTTAATGITVNSLAAALQATNSTSGNINVTQAASPVQALTTGGSGVVNNAAGGTISITNLGSTFTVAAGAPVTSSNGAITLLATDFTILNTINSGTAITTLGNSQVGTAIDIGTDNVFGKISLTQTELNFVTASLLRIGTATAGSITISQPITAPATVNGALHLINNGAITEAAVPATAALTATNLGISSTGPVTLSNVNNIANLSSSTTNAIFVNNGTNTLTVPNAGFDGVSGVVTSNSNITLEADNILLKQVVTPGTATVILEPFTTTLNMTLGAASVPATTFGITNGGLGWITSGVTQIGVAADTGTIAITGAINRTPTATAPTRSQTLSLVTSNTTNNPLVGSTTGAITQTAALSVANLETTAVGGVQLTNAGNDVDTIAGSVTGGTTVQQNFRFVDAPSVAGTTLTVGSVAGVTGITTAGSTFLELTTSNALTLTDGLKTGNGGAIGLSAGTTTQAAAAIAAIVSGNLTLIGAGGYTLTNVSNSVGNLSGNTTNGVSYTNAGNLLIGFNSYVDGFGAPAFTGITTSNAPISVNTIDGTLTVASGDAVNAGSSTVSLTAGSNADNRLLDIEAAVTGNGGVTLTGDNMTINAAVTAGTSAGVAVALLQPFTSGQFINLGGADGSGTLGLTAAEINQVTAGVIRVGNSNAGDLTITAPINPTGSNQLELITGNHIVNTAAAPALTVTRLGITAGAGIGTSATPITTQVSNLEAATNSGGIFVTNSTTALTIGGVNGTLAGVRVNGAAGDITIVNNNTINITTHNDIVQGPGNVTLTANGAASNIVTGGNNGVPGNAGAIVSTGAGTTLTLNAGQDILIGNAGFGDVQGGGSIVLNAARDIVVAGNSFVDAHGAGTITGTAGRDINLTASGIGDRVRTEGGAINLTTGANGTLFVNSGTGTSTITTSQNPANGFGNITINADHVVISSSDGINAGTAIVTIQQVTGSEAIQLGTATDAELDLSVNELTRITGSTLRIGSTGNAGNISVTAPVSVPNVTTLSLRTGGSVSDNAAADKITVNSLAVQAATGINLDTVTSNLAFNNITSGAVAIHNTGGMTIGNVDFVSTSANNGAGSTTTILDTTGGPLTFGVNTTSKGTLTGTTIEGSPDGVGANEENLTVNAGVLVRSVTGNIILTAADSLTTAVGSTQQADAGSVTLQAGVGDTDNDATITLGGTIISLTGITILAPGDIVLTTPINAPGQTVSITSTAGAILDGNDIPSGTAVVNINANLLALSAFTGIGRTNAANPAIVLVDAPLETQVNSLEAQTTTGGIFIHNNNLTSAATLNIGGVTGAINGIQDTGASGDIVVTNNGAIKIITSGEIVKGPGDVTVQANGANSDVVTGGGNTLSSGAIVSTGGTTTVTAGRDILIGNPGGGPGNRIGDVSGGGSVVFAAGRHIVVDVFSEVDAHGTGTVTATAGGNISILHSGAPPLTGAMITSEGGAITLTTGANGLLTIDGDTGPGTIRTTQAGGNGNININADRINLTTNDGVNAGTGIVTIKQVSPAWAINLGSTVDNTPSTLELSNAEINEITASVLRIGDPANAGTITVSAPINDTTTFPALDLRTGGGITENGGATLTVTNLSLQAAGVVNAAQANAVSTLSGQVTGIFNSFTFDDTINLDITTVDGLNGITTNDGVINITDSLTLTVDLIPLASFIKSFGGAINLTAASFVNDANAIVDSTTAGAPPAGIITITADNMTLNTGGIITSGTNRTVLKELTAGTLINIGGADSLAPLTLGLTNAEINTVTAGQIQIGDQGSGAATITAAIVPTGTTVLDLESGSTLTELAGGTVKIANLAIRTIGSVTMGNLNDVLANLAALVTGVASSFVFIDSDAVNPLNIGTADGLSGITTNGGVISVTATVPAINVNTNVSSGAANITLTAVGTDSFINNNSPAAITDSGGHIITLQANEMALNAGSSITAAGVGGRVILEASTAGRLINLGPTLDPLGSLNLSNAELNTVSAPAGVLQIGSGIEGNVTVGTLTPITISPANAPTVSINTAGLINGSGALTVGNLRLSAGNGVNLTGANVVSGQLAGNVSTGSQAFVFDNTGSLVIGIADGVNGITTNNGAITVTTTGGNLTVNQNVSAGTALVNLTAGGLDSLFTNNALITGGSSIITADEMALGTLPNQSISVGTAPTNIVTLQPFTANRPVNLDNTAGDPSGELRLSQTELNTVTAGILRVGGTLAGALTLKTPIVAPGPSTMSLISGAGIGQAATTDIITATNLALQGATVNLQGNNIVVQLAGTVPAAGAFTFVDDHDLNIGTVDSVSGLNSNGGVVNVTVENPALVITDPGVLTVSSVSTDPGGNFNFVADNMTINAAINAGAAGLVTLKPFDAVVTSINLGGADGNTTLGLTSAELAQVTAGVLRVGSTASATPIVITTAVSIPNATTLSLQTGSSLTETGAGAPSGTNLSINANSLGGSLATPFLINEAELAVSTTGSVFISNTNPAGLDIPAAALDGLLGIQVPTSGQAINVKTTGPLTVDGLVSGLGTTTVTLSSAAAGQDLAVDFGANVSSGTGAIVLNGGRNITVAGTVSTGAPGTITLNGGASGVNTTTINTLNGTLTAAAGAILNGGNLADLFDIKPINGTPLTIHGLLPTTAPGDVLSMDINAVTGLHFTPAGVGAGSYTFTNRSSVTYDGIETVNTFNSAAISYEVGDFAGYGVFRYTAITGWQSLHSAFDASLIGVDGNGNVFADFPGYGLFRNVGGVWTQLGTPDASLLSVSANGMAAVDFPGYGLFRFDPATGFTQYHTADASHLGIDGTGNIVADFPGYGIYKFTSPATNTQLSKSDCTLLAVDALGGVVADFAGYGIQRYVSGTTFSQISKFDADALAVDAAGDVVADFGVYGLNYLTHGNVVFNHIGSPSTRIAMDLNGDVLGDFPGYGVQLYTILWTVQTPVDAYLLGTNQG